MNIDLNQVIAEISIAMKLDKSLDPIIAKYGNETVGEAMQFINYQEQEIIEQEEDYE
jgi:hypothetical protein